MARGRTIRLTQLLVVAIKIWFIKCENRGWKWKGFNSICSWYIDRYYISIFVQYIDRYFNIRSIYWSIFRYSFNISIDISIFFQYVFYISIDILIFFQYVFIFLNLFRYPFNIINTILSYFSIFAKNFPTFLDKLSIKFSSYRKQFRYTRNYFNIIKFYINTAFLRNVLRYRSDFWYRAEAYLYVRTQNYQR